MTNICPENPDSVICQNVRELDIASLGNIDALALGFPCNSISSKNSSYKYYYTNCFLLYLSHFLCYNSNIRTYYMIIRTKKRYIWLIKQLWH